MTSGAQVSVHNGAIWVSDAMPETATLQRNARDVHQHATEMLAGGCSPQEYRWVCKTLLATLGDVLRMMDD